MEHLNNKFASYITNLTDEERIYFAQKPKWIGYESANIILENFDKALNYPTKNRMPNFLLVGDSNNGKTALLNKFLSKNQSFVNDLQEMEIPVVFIQAPPEPDEKRFYNSILEEIFAPYKTSERVESRQQRVLHLLRKMKTKAIIIDEIQHVLAGTISKQRTFLNVIKYLANELKIPLICSGTREAFNVIQTDPQLSNRFKPFVLNRWGADEQFLRLLASFEQTLPLLKASALIETSIAQKILQKSEGLIGEVNTILELSTTLAIESKLEKINHSVLDNIDYVSPQNRKKIISSI